jgi:hypothetical protein
MRAPQQVVYVQVGPKNGLGTASFVIGLAAAVVGLGPIIGAIFSIPAGVVGLALGLANIGRLRAKTATNKWMTISGLVLCALGITFGIISAVLFNHAMHQL